MLQRVNVVSSEIWDRKKIALLPFFMDFVNDIKATIINGTDMSI
jgi:hypothetical protein